MKKIDWMRKLTSRKLWLSVASFVTLMVVCARRHRKMKLHRSLRLLWPVLSVIGYVIGEGMTDAAAIEAKRAEQEGQGDPIISRRGVKRVILGRLRSPS